jgi:type IV pilus assembly protein PilN
MRFTEILKERIAIRHSKKHKAIVKSGLVKFSSVGNRRTEYNYQPPREARFLDRKKTPAEKLHQWIYLTIQKHSKKYKKPQVIERPRFHSLPPPAVTPKVKAERITRRSQNASLLRKASKFIKTVSDDIVYCYDRSINFITFYNLRHEGLIGVDITPHCIYLCQIDGLNGKRVLTSLTSVCMEGKFLNEDISKNPNDYADSLKNLIKDNNIKTKNVAISIPVSNSIVKTVTIPTMDDEEIQKALKFGSLWNNLMHSNQNPEDYSIFYQVIRRHKSHENMDVLFVATKLSDVSLYTDIVKNSGLNPVIVDVRCFAISNAFNHKRNTTETTGPNVFLEFSSEENYAMIIDGDGAHIFDINITDTQRSILTDSLIDEALIDSFAESYARQVQNTIAQYKDRHNTAAIKNLFVLSSAPTANTIIDKLTKLLEDYDISHCNFFDCMNIRDDFTINAKSAKQNISAWAACIGTALRKIDILGRTQTPKYNTNMLPNPNSYAQEKRIKYVLHSACAAASVALICFVVTTHQELSAQNEELSNQLALLDGVQENYNLALAKDKQFSLAINDVESINNLTAEVSGNQKKLLSIHQYLGMVLVDNVWLKEMTFSAPDNIEIIGAATQDKSILEFINILNEGKQFDKVALKDMNEVHEMSISDPYATTVKNFTINGTISANIPISAPIPEKVHIMAGDVNQGT